MMNQHLILIVSWLLYCVLHSVLAYHVVKVKVIKALGLTQAGYRLLYNVFALVSLLALLYYHFRVESILLFGQVILHTYIAPCVIIFGLAGMLICIVKYFRQLSGLKVIQITPKPILETSGIHRYVRHPLYISTFIFLIGLFFLVPTVSNLIAVIIIIVYTIIGIGFEEKKLINEFGQQYIEYKRKVPMLIPFLKF